MPKLISTKNLGNPSTDDYVLQSTTAGVRSWAASGVGIASDGTNVGSATTINWQNRQVTPVTSGIATVLTDPFTIVGL